MSFFPSGLSTYNPCPETRLTEFGSAAVALWWALLLLLPVHLFRTNVAFEFLPRIGPEWAWGIAGLTVGAIQSLAAVRRRPALRWLGAFLSAMLWGGVCACLAYGCLHFHGLPLNTGCGCYAVMVVLANVSAILLTPYVLADFLAWWHRRRAAWGQQRHSQGG